MTKEQYIRITGFLREKPARVQAVKICNKILTGVLFLGYPMFLAGLLWKRDLWLARAIIIPLDSFLVVSFLRYLIHAERPYEKFGIPPVLEKDTKGKSFPSRHVFSAFMIAMTFFYKIPWLGISGMLIGIVLGVLRVLGGVHEPRDVIAGALCGIACGFLGYYVF